MTFRMTCIRQRGVGHGDVPDDMNTSGSGWGVVTFRMTGIRKGGGLKQTVF